MNLVDETLDKPSKPEISYKLPVLEAIIIMFDKLQPSQRNEFTNKLKENLTSGLQLARDFVVLNAPDLANDPSLKLY